MFDAIQTTVRDRQPTYPPEKSAGGTNTYTIKDCRVAGHTPGYCVCLNKVMAFERDEGLASYPECDRAIDTQTCPALAMREEERLAGKALYYIDRALLREEMDKAFAATAASRPSKTTAVTPPAKPAASTAALAKPLSQRPSTSTSTSTSPLPSSEGEVDGYAAAINAAIKEAAQTAPVTPPAPAPTPIPEPKVASPSPSPVTKGLSMLERARLQMGLNKENS